MTKDQVRRIKAQIFILQDLGLGMENPAIDGEPCFVSFNDTRVVVVVAREELARRVPTKAHQRPVEVIWFDYSRIGAGLAAAIHDVADPDTKLTCWVQCEACTTSGSYTLSELAALSRQADVKRLEISGTSTPK